MRHVVSKIALGVVALSCLTTGARAGLITSTVPAGGIDYIRFTSTGGFASFNIWADGFTGGPTGVWLDDSMITLAVDDGSPIGALTGAIVGFNDDSNALGWDDDGSTSTADSFLTLNLAAGDYILGVGSFLMEESEFRSGIASSPSQPGDFQLTFEGVEVAGAPVPEPSTLAMGGMAVALAGLGAYRRRRRANA